MQRRWANVEMAGLCRDRGAMQLCREGAEKVRRRDGGAMQRR